MPSLAHSIHRAMADITLGVVKSTRARDARDREMGLSEHMQQFQFTMSGTATTTLGFMTAQIDFDYPYYYAPGQRDSDLDRPHIYTGYEMAADVAVTIRVTDWTLDADNGAVIGATVRVGFMAADDGVAFSGVGHVAFQGFTALAEAEPDED